MCYIHIYISEQFKIHRRYRLIFILVYTIVVVSSAVYLPN